MGLTGQWGQNHYFGEHADDATANSFITGILGAGTVAAGMIYYNTTVTNLKLYDGSAWVVTGVSSHSALSGLANDDHLQYHTDARGDLRYYLKTQLGSTTAGNEGAALIGTDTKANLSNATDVEVALTATNTHVGDATIHFTEGSIDHGSIQGLADDDHTQYLLVSGTRAMSGNLNMNSNFITSLPTPTSTDHAATKGYVDSLFQGAEWIESVIDFFDPTGGLPSGPTNGDRYISSATANGWVANNVYEYNSSTPGWDQTVADEGMATWNETLNTAYVFNGTSWVKMASVFSHNDLNGLQGGTTAEYYHFTQAQHTEVTSFFNNTDITGAEAERLSDGSDVSSGTVLHTHDTAYYTKTQLGSTTSGSEGAALIGTDTKTNLNSATDVETALTYLDGLNPPKVNVGTTNPNTTGITGKPGDIYIHQRTGRDLCWMNTDGTTSGWVTL